MDVGQALECLPCVSTERCCCQSVMHRTVLTARMLSRHKRLGFVAPLAATVPLVRLHVMQCAHICARTVCQEAVGSLEQRTSSHWVLGSHLGPAAATCCAASNPKCDVCLFSWQALNKVTPVVQVLAGWPTGPAMNSAWIFGWYGTPCQSWLQRTPLLPMVDIATIVLR